jgi:hypothetical protein
VDMAGNVRRVETMRTAAAPAPPLTRVTPDPVMDSPTLQTPTALQGLIDIGQFVTLVPAP